MRGAQEAQVPWTRTASFGRCREVVLIVSVPFRYLFSILPFSTFFGTADFARCSLLEAKKIMGY